MRAKPQLEARPEWDERFEGWAAKFVAKNMWRCEGYDPQEKFKDLMQDAYLIFRHVLASYPLITEPSHIMALFKTAMVNEFNDKAKYKQRKYAAEVSLEYVITEDLKLIDSLGEENNEGYLRVILSELPPEVRAALDVFNDEEKVALLRKEKIQSRLAKLAGLPSRRESLNDTLCRILKIRKGIDLMGILHDALSK